MAPRAVLEGCGKSRPLPGFDTRTVEPVASRYTDCAIATHDNSSNKLNTIMERWWNDTEGGEPKYWDKNLSQCHCVHHKSHFD